ncbi:MAG: addiction module antitoxin [Sedimenticola sp.]
MSDTMNLNVRISGALKDYVSHEIKQGAFENVSEYVRDLIRRDMARSEQAAFEKLKAELKLAYSAPDSDYIELSASDITGSKPPEQTE